MTSGSTALSALTIVAVGLAGCGGPDGPGGAVAPEASVATTILLSHASVHLASFGAVAQLTATVRDQNGLAMSEASVSWTSSAASVATVSPSGLVTAEGNGQATITASSGSLTSTATVTVDVPPLAADALCSSHVDAAIASFADPNLEARTRSALGLAPDSDITCAQLAGLTGLVADDAGIVSLVGIQNLTGLTTLDLSGNQISEAGSLAGLTSLVTLDLSDNPDLADLQPLLDNSGLGFGDAVDVSGTSVECADVDALRAKAISVTSDCPVPMADVSGLVFAGWAPPELDGGVYRIEPDGTGRELIVPGGGNTGPRAFTAMPSEGLIAMSSLLQLAIVDPLDIRPPVHVPHNVLSPTWSESAQRIAFHLRVPQGNSNVDGGLWTVEADGSGLTQVLPPRDASLGDRYDLAWSPDGVSLAGTVLSSDVHQEVFIVGADGAGFRWIDPNPPADVEPLRVSNPAWSPDGGTLAVHVTFSRGGLLRTGIGLIDVDDSGLELVTEQDAAAEIAEFGDFEPCWSPEGDEIAFSRRWVEGGVYRAADLMVIELIGLQERQVLAVPRGTHTGASRCEWR